MTTNPPVEYELAAALKELTRLRAELAKVQASERNLLGLIQDSQAEIAQAKSDAAAWNRSFHDANAERLRLREALEMLRMFQDSAR